MKNDNVIEVANREFSDIEEFRQFISAKQKIIDKNLLLMTICEKKKVLDLGCIDHSSKTAIELGEKWLHRNIKDIATSTVGFDILADDAADLNRLGYEIEVGDAQDFDLKRTFDVVVAGDLIEHLSNVGGFLESVKKHLANDSVFVFTTPNPFCIEQVWQAAFNHQVVVNTQHTAWLDPIVSWQVLKRHNLKITGFHWIDTRFRNYVYSTPWRHLANRVTDSVIKRVPLLRRDFAIIATRDTP